MTNEKRVCITNAKATRYVAKEYQELDASEEASYAKKFETPMGEVYQLADSLPRRLNKFPVVNNWVISNFRHDIFFDPLYINKDTGELEPSLYVKIAFKAHGTRIGYDWIGNENPTDAQVLDEKNWKKLPESAGLTT